MFGRGAEGFQRLLAVLAGDEEAGGQNLTGPTAVVLNTTSEDPQGQTRNDQVLLMSIPGMGVVGTGLHLGDNGELAGETLGLAMRAALGQMMRAFMEQSMQEQEGPSSPPASETLRDALPRVVVTKEELLDESNARCPVCWEDYALGSKVTRMLCGHLYCTNCIREWLRSSNSCPVCRFELATDDAEFEVGRLERMRGRAMRLKTGELRMLRVPELKRLMRALGISGDGCVEKADLVKRLSDASEIDIVADQEGVLYEREELDSLELPSLRNLMERHGLPKIPNGLSDEAERVEAIESFLSAGWVTSGSPSAPSGERPRRSAGAAGEEAAREDAKAAEEVVRERGEIGAEREAGEASTAEGGKVAQGEAGERKAAAEAQTAAREEEDTATAAEAEGTSTRAAQAASEAKGDEAKAAANGQATSAGEAQEKEEAAAPAEADAAAEAVAKEEAAPPTEDEAGAASSDKEEAAPPSDGEPSSGSGAPAPMLTPTRPRDAAPSVPRPRRRPSSAGKPAE